MFVHPRLVSLPGGAIDIRNKTSILKQRGRGSKCTYGRTGKFDDILDEAKLSLICRKNSKSILTSTLCPVLSIVTKTIHSTWYFVPATWGTHTVEHNTSTMQHVTSVRKHTLQHVVYLMVSCTVASLSGSPVFLPFVAHPSSSVPTPSSSSVSTSDSSLSEHPSA